MLSRSTFPLLVLLISITSWSCQETSPIGTLPETDQIDRELRNAIHWASPDWKYTDYIFPDAGDLARIPQDPRNPLTPEKVQLGRWLYHETGLAKVAVREEGMLTYSCASCHHAKAGFQANRRQGIGEGGLGFGMAGEGRQKDLRYEDLELDVQPIRSPSALNVAYQEVMLWNGQFGATGPNAGTEAQWTEGTPKAVNNLGYQGVETQAIAGLTVHRMQVDSALMAELGYKNYFDRSFPKFPQHNRYSLETAGLAIAAYERTLMPQYAPFQDWLKGERDAMTYRQKYGALLFFGEAGCANCHQGPAMSGPGFYALGMPDLSGPDVFNVAIGDDAHLGRGGFTGNMEELHQFKVPQLYNLKDSPFFGHGASFFSLEEVLNYKNQAVSANPRVATEKLSEEFSPLYLSSNQIEALVDFLENGLYDSELRRFEPMALPSGQCFPNADSQSREDMDCF